ncbi:MFS general substrate transporter [Schizophyllum commune H4-8]|nr:MFS general substrate transporter [Schizophyllum commune H4-8]KAI5896228.1 MFS general substrate transporter [Schizophyllum commune H4-8]
MATNGAAATMPAPKDMGAGLRPESPPSTPGKELVEEPHPTYKTDFGFLLIPRRLRHDPARPFEWTLLLNISFGFASTFTVANLYYCQPLLIELAAAFDVSYGEVSIIPTLVQAGYAVGLLLISPLGDLVRRRQLIIGLVLISTCLTIGLAVTSSLRVFSALTFLVGFVTVTPQILMPLAADLAPPARRASALALVLAGLLLGVLVARVLAGIVAQFSGWRVVYYVAIGVQALILVWCWAIIPDVPRKNRGLTYWHILVSMGRFAVTEPTLIQACLINMASSAVFASFWVTLTFLLGGPPYYYNTLVIGLFGLVGMLGIAASPLVGRAVDGLVPWNASLISIVALIVFQAIQVGANGINVAAVIIGAFGLDVFRQMLQVSLTTAIFKIDGNARARLNAVLILSLFLGQVMGTAAGTHVFTEYGWRACAGLSMGWCGWQLLILLARGPRCARKTWVGWEGGWGSWKEVKEKKEAKSEGKQAVSEAMEPSYEAKGAGAKGSAPSTEAGAVPDHKEEPQ